MVDSAKSDINPAIAGQHGGARKNAGRRKGTGASKKTLDQVKTHPSADPYIVLTKAKAKRETFRAALTELEYRHKAGDLCEVQEALRVISTAIAVFTEQVRSIPDHLERAAGLTPAQAAIAEDEINNQLLELQARLTDTLDQHSAKRNAHG